jgi:NTE family protein
MLKPPKFPLGLALGSGAARGWAHLGVLKALTDLGIRPDVVCATSMGALAGGFHVGGQLAELEEWARKLTKLRMIRYMDFRLGGSGLIGGNRLFSEMERSIGDMMIEDLPVRFASVATDLKTGHEIWFTEGKLIEAIRASFSLPGFFEAVRVKGRWVIDGALVNPVPVSVCHALGARVVIAVNLNVTSPGRNGPLPGSGSVDADFTLTPGLDGNVLRRASRKLHLLQPVATDEKPDTPTRIGVMAATLNIVQDRVTRSRLAADPPDVTLIPRVGHIGFLDFHCAAEAIDAGEASVHAAEEAIREAIALFGHVPF